MRTSGNIYLVNRLTEFFNIVGMVVLSPPIKSRKEVYETWYRHLKKHGILITLNKFLFLKLANKKVDRIAIEKKYFGENSNSKDYQYNEHVLYTYDINSLEVSEFIKKRSPDLIVVCGSNIIQPKIFTLAPLGAINIHSGITPDYRCANPVEWALYKKDFNKVGVTIHFIDEGIDTGDVIYQKTVKIEKGDTISSIYCKNTINGAVLMKKAIDDIALGKLKIWSPDTKKGNKYLSIQFGLLQYIRARKNLSSISK